MRALSLNVKIATLIGALIAATGGIAFLGIAQMKSLKAGISEVSEVSATALLVKGLETRLYALKALERETIYNTGNSEWIEHTIKKIVAEEERVDGLLKQLQGRSSDSDGLRQFAEAFASWKANRRGTEPLIRAGKRDEAAKAIFGRSNDLIGSMELLIEDLVSSGAAQADARLRDANTAFERSRGIIVGIAVPLILASLILTTWLLRASSRVIREVIGEIEAAGLSVSRTGKLLQEASESVAQVSTEAAAAVEEIGASVRSIHETVKSSATRSSQASDISKDGKILADAGQAQVRDLESAMQDSIAQSRKIEDIIGIIEDISFQTNLLALNAAVEAARAGEHGRGFAVVAEAVRALAQKSASALKDISDLIKGSVKSIERGGSLVSANVQIFQDIVTSVNRLTEISTEIANLCEKQVQTLGEVAKSVEGIGTSTQLSSRSASETTSLATDLGQQSESLRSSMLRLATVLNGGAGA